MYDGTDDNIRRTFCQLQFENYIKTPTGRWFVILKPVQNEVKLFYPTLLSNLPTLNISLIKPNGELINNTEDGIEILNIREYQKYYLKIQTKTFFDKDAFFTGDYILIKNFSIFNYHFEDTTVTDNDINLFNQFINKENGHMIYEVGVPNEHGFYNSFHIFAPGTFNKQMGEFDVEEEQLGALLLFNNYLESENRMNKENLNGYENGYILNMSLQNSISMTVEMNKQDPSKLTKKTTVK